MMVGLLVVLLASFLLGFYGMFRDWGVGSIVACFIVALGSLVVLVVLDAKEWEIYKSRYHCKRTEDMRIIPIMTCTYTGKTTICVPIMTTQHRWTCDTDAPDTEVWRP